MVLEMGEALITPEDHQVAMSGPLEDREDTISGPDREGNTTGLYYAEDDDGSTR